MHPGAERGVTSEIANLLERMGPRVLRQVGGQLVVASHAPDHRVHPGGVPLVKLPHRLDLARPGPADQGGLS